ncbi:MAG: hypothetical protein KC609_03490 [Myxococcales bacterium]|nr:hypothetical protein [Myxococcales bacterium]
MNPRRVASAAVLFLLGASLCASSVEAKSFADWTRDRYVLAAVSGALGAGGLVTTTANGLIASTNERPHFGWRFSGYLLSTLNVGWSVVLFTSTGLKYNRKILGLGAAHLFLGVLDLGMTIYGHRQRERGPQVKVQPTILPTAGGNLAYGVGVGVYGW